MPKFVGPSWWAILWTILCAKVVGLFVGPSSHEVSGPLCEIFGDKVDSPFCGP